MPLYIVSYDLINKGNRTYQELYDALQSFTYWYHPMESTWFVESDLQSSGVYERLRPFVSDVDGLLVVEIKKDTHYNGWLSKKFWPWIKERLDNGK